MKAKHPPHELGQNPRLDNIMRDQHNDGKADITLREFPLPG